VGSEGNKTTHQIDVKTFLMKKFEEGERTGNKADPVQVAMEMKTLRNENGEPMFNPEGVKESAAD